MLAKILTIKAAVLAATTVLGAGAAAAATGSLPDAAQSRVSDALAHVSVSVPNPHANAHAGAKGDNGKSGDHKPDPKAPNANADFGHCTAFLAAPNSHANEAATDTNTHSGKDASTAFTAFISAHGGVDSTKTYCAGVIAAHDAAHAADASDPKGAKPDTAGKSGSHAKVTTPNGGGTDTADAGSDGASTDGSANAGAHSTHKP